MTTQCFLLSPGNKIYTPVKNQTPEDYISNHPNTFGGLDLNGAIRTGWVSTVIKGGEAYIMCKDGADLSEVAYELRDYYGFDESSTVHITRAGSKRSSEAVDMGYIMQAPSKKSASKSAFSLANFRLAVKKIIPEDQWPSWVSGIDVSDWILEVGRIPWFLYFIWEGICCSKAIIWALQAFEARGDFPLFESLWEKCNSLYPGLPLRDALAIFFYTVDSTPEGGLFDGRQLKDTDYTHYLSHARKIMPPFTGKLHRCMNVQPHFLEGVTKGKGGYFFRWQSFAAPPEGQSHNWAGNCHLILNTNGVGYSIAGLSKFPHEYEVLVPPGTMYKVTKVIPGASVTTFEGAITGKENSLFGSFPVYSAAYQCIQSTWLDGKPRAGVVFSFPDGSILGCSPTGEPGEYDLPKGHIDAGEDPIIAALRELQEETSLELEARELTPLGVFPFGRGVIHLYRYTSPVPFEALSLSCPSLIKDCPAHPERVGSPEIADYAPIYKDGHTGSFYGSVNYVLTLAGAWGSHKPLIQSALTEVPTAATPTKSKPGTSKDAPGQLSLFDSTSPVVSRAPSLFMQAYSKAFPPHWLLSATLLELLDDTDLDFIHRKQHLDDTKAVGAPKIMRVFGSTIQLAVKSEKFATNQKVYSVYVMLKDIKLLMKDKQIDVDEAVRYALTDCDCKVYCNCPSFLYHGFRYEATQMEYLYGPHKENRFPAIRNPHLRDSKCKHIHLALETVLDSEDRLCELFGAYYKKLPEVPEGTMVSQPNTPELASRTDKDGQGLLFTQEEEGIGLLFDTIDSSAPADDIELEPLGETQEDGSTYIDTDIGDNGEGEEGENEGDFYGEGNTPPLGATLSGEDLESLATEIADVETGENDYSASPDNKFTSEWSYNRARLVPDYALLEVL